MNNTFFILFLLISTFSFGQQFQGVINYKHTQYFEFENMPADAPKSQATFKRLFFTDLESLYETNMDIKIEEAEAEGMRGMMMRRFRDRSERILHKNLDTDIMIEQMGFFGKDFLVTDTIVLQQWKISAGEQKDIAGYTCIKAILKDTSSRQIIAFFTPQIPVSTGPDFYGSLPGMILEIQSAQTHIIATEVNLQPLTKAIMPPKKGEKMNRAKFEKLRAEKTKEMREMWGNRGQGSRPRG